MENMCLNVYCCHIILFFPLLLRIYLVLNGKELSLIGDKICSECLNRLLENERKLKI